MESTIAHGKNSYKLNYRTILIFLINSIILQAIEKILLVEEALKSKKIKEIEIEKNTVHSFT
jgi:hypothetical protein